jgi:hypothetical protein
MHGAAGIKQIIIWNGREKGRDKKVLVVIRPLESVFTLYIVQCMVKGMYRAFI